MIADNRRTTESAYDDLIVGMNRDDLSSSEAGTRGPRPFGDRDDSSDPAVDRAPLCARCPNEASVVFAGIELCGICFLRSSAADREPLRNGLEPIPRLHTSFVDVLNAVMELAHTVDRLQGSAAAQARLSDLRAVLRQHARAINACGTRREF